MWVPAEVKDPILLHAPTRKSVGYFGAVRLRDGKLLTKREEKAFDAETFWQFLKLLRQVSSRSGRRVAVISDNAKYHHALLHREWRQQLEPRFALHFLPSYSPQLNPIERIWKLTRRLCLRARTKNPSSWGTALEPVSQGPAARGPQPSYGSIAAIKDLNGTWASGPSAPRWAIVALPARNKVWRPTLGPHGVPRLRGTAALQVRNDHEELWS